MAKNPLLIFTAPKAVNKRDDLPPFVSSIQSPPFNIQADRVISKVEKLECKFAEYIELAETAEGFLPEKVLVLEVAGEIQGLANALARVKGFEYLSSTLLEKSFDSEDYYALSNFKRTPTSKNAYLTMSNQSGLSRLLALWREYQRTRTVERGYGPLKDVFNRLIDIRFWDTRDRLEATSVVENWQGLVEDAAAGFDAMVPFEIELWYRALPAEQAKAEMRIRRLIGQAGGDITGGCIHEGISYHALVGQLPVSRVQQVLAEGAEVLELMRCDDVMYL